MSDRNEESRPTTGPGAALHNESVSGEVVTLSVPEADAYAASVDGGFVVVVEVRPDRYRRRVFLSSAAAERHARRARARGQGVKIVLARLTPLYLLMGTARPELLGGGA